MRRTVDETHFAGPDRIHFRREPFEPGERLLSGRILKSKKPLVRSMISSSMTHTRDGKKSQAFNKIAILAGEFSQAFEASLTAKAKLLS
ncbi:hypothetical protein L596_010484 [Steinernema carpocapsae]|uniref:Uncharacterized protein n=1 Tax=Steinernema carpocapsae TaxID=34508 RepID=A0A4U5PJU3_STECR|nr:hypothetical protein L596_010484 [Steinernema carpocapsae]